MGVYVDPDVQAMIDRQKASGFRSYGEQNILETRQRFMDLAKARRGQGETTQVAKVWDTTIPGPAGPMPVRYYRPSDEVGLPIIAYFHGGGFAIGSIDTHDEQARALCMGVDAIVCSVEYRLAPEDPFPAGYDDCVAAVEYLRNNADEVGADPTRLGVAGDSAGANLSAALAVNVGAAGGIHAALLNYGTLDHESDYDPDDVPLENLTVRPESVKWFRDMYSSAEERLDPRVSPLMAEDFSVSPPSVVVLAELDYATRGGKAYAAKLEEAGVPVDLLVFPGLIHGFYMYKDVVPAAAEAARTAYATFKPMLHRAPDGADRKETK